VILESSREIDWGGLHLRNRIYGGTGSDSGLANGGTRVSFAEADKVTAIKARVRVNGVEAKGCDSNTIPTRAVVRLSGFFFNTTTQATVNDATNDVLAYIALQRQSGSTDKPYLLHVVAYVYRCTNPGCGTAALIGTWDFGTISLFKAAEISIQWDEAYHQFIFTLNRQSPVYIPYDSQYNTSPPGIQKFKRIEVNNFLPNCTSEPRPVAFMDAFIDNVFVNLSAAA
jgi:hypothetical protein